MKACCVTAKTKTALQLKLKLNKINAPPKSLLGINCVKINFSILHSSGFKTIPMHMWTSWMKMYFWICLWKSIWIKPLLTGKSKEMAHPHPCYVCPQHFKCCQHQWLPVSGRMDCFISASHYCTSVTQDFYIWSSFQ